jgi:hypothetical protein
MGRLGCAFIESAVAKVLRAKYRSGLDLILALANSPKVQQLNIITLNHDTLVEQFLSANKVSSVDGFGVQDGGVRWFDDNVYESAEARVRLFKLHGSINWYSFLHGGGSRTALLLARNALCAKDGTGKQLTARFARPSFLSGVNKSVAYQRGLFADIHFHFAELLRQCDHMLMSGYGWGDTVINFQLDTWLDRSQSNRITLLHKNSGKLRDKSLIMASGYDGWVKSGQLICIDRWLSEVSLTDLDGFFI